MVTSKPARRDLLGPWAVGLLVAALPLAATPLATDPIMPVRFLVLAAGITLGCFAAGTGRLPRLLPWALGCAAAVFVLAALVSATPWLSLLGRYPRYEGLPMMAAYAACLWLGARLAGPDAKRTRDLATSALAIGTIVQGLVAVVQVIATPDVRVTGLLGNSTTLGTWGVLSFAMLGWRASTGKRPLWLAGAAAGAMILVLSASRGALVGVGAAAVMATVILLRSRSRRWWLPGAVALGTVVAMLLVPTGRARLTGATPFAEATVTGRLLLWQETLALLVNHPFLGVGPSRFVDSIVGFHTAAWAAAVGPYAPPDSPHTLVLQVAAATGLLGLAVVLIVAGLAVWPLLRVATLDSWQCGALCVAVGVGVTYLTSFTDPITTPVTALLLGGALAQRSGPLASAWRERSIGVLTAAVGLILGGTLVAAEYLYTTGAGQAYNHGPALVKATTARPFDPDLARRVGYTLDRLAEKGHVDPLTAVPLLRSTCSKLPGSVECLLALADAQDLAGDHNAALTTLNAALALDPFNVDTYLKRGIALASATRYPEAEAAFLKAVELRPTAPEPWTNLATLYQLMGRTSDATAASAQAAQLAKR